MPTKSMVVPGQIQEPRPRISSPMEMIESQVIAPSFTSSPKCTLAQSWIGSGTASVKTKQNKQKPSTPVWHGHVKYNTKYLSQSLLTHVFVI